MQYYLGARTTCNRISNVATYGPVKMWALHVATFAALLLTHHSQGQVIHTPGDVEAYLLFSSRYKITRFNIDVTNYMELQQNAGEIVALDFDYQSGYYYWSNQLDRNIYRASLTGGPGELVVHTGNHSQVDGLAVDWINKQLYWTDLPFGTIKRLDLDGFTNEVVVIATEVVNPRGIVLDPRNDMMYFTDVNIWAPNIQRARMSNVTQRQVIVSEDLMKPNAITMDYDTDRLYFADALTDKIESCNLDGSDRVVLLNQQNFFHPYDLTLYDDRIYWTDLYQHSIVNAHKDHGGDRIRIIGPIVYPYVIHAVHPSRQLTEDPHYCESNGGRGLCESNCTSFSTGYTCGCYDGYMLNDDLHTCSDVNECAFDNGGCSHICSNSEGTFECRCIEGFALLPDGVTCIDNNECNDNRGGCEYGCNNTDSGFNCLCPHGYELQTDQRTCQDIDECQMSPCPAEAQCIDRDGSFACSCPAGFVYDVVSTACRDIDECLAGQSTCTQRCDNQPGTFSCSCHDGFVLDEEDGITCSDIDECEDNLHGCQQMCVNVIGSYVCLCNAGFRPVGDGHSCSPIDCGPTEDIDGFSITCTGTSYGSTCSLSCIQGTLIGVSTITCLMNGMWSISTAECISTEDTGGVNDPPHAIIPSSFSVPEDTGSGVTLGTLHTIDSDNHESYTYTLTADASGKFYIDMTDNTLKTHGGLDYETTPIYTIQVTTVDTGTPPLSGNFDLTIAILDVNEPPSEPTLSSNTIAEHASVGDLVGMIFSSDPDQGQEKTFSLVSNGGGKFNLQGDRLLVASTLNFEETDTYTVVVLVEDNGTPQQTNINNFTIIVQDENDSPTGVQLTGSEIPEVSPDSATAVGTVIGSLTTEDEDSSDTHTYTLGGPHSTCFSVATSDLVVSDTSCFDHETNPTLPLTVISRDPTGMSAQQAFLVIVTDINETPSGITLSSSIILEHVAVDTIVGTLTVTDPDQGDTHQLTVMTGGSLFAVQGNALVVSADLSFSDYPTGVALAVQATDSANHAYTESFTISVQNVNEPPDDITWQVFEMCSTVDESINGLDIHACVTENTPVNTRIAVATATDPDLDVLTLDFIDSGNIFHFDHSGTLKVGDRGLNFESPLVGVVHSVTVAAEDPEGLTSTSQFNIKIINENDPPTSIEVSTTFVGASTAVGQSAAVLRCIDEDVGDRHTFRLTDNAAGKFTIDSDQLKVSQDLSSLAGNQYPITVQCSDGNAELTTPVTFIINVFEDGTSPPGSVDISIYLSQSRIAEQEPANTHVGSLNAVTSPTREFNFTIVGGASHLFSIHQGADGSSTELRTTQPLDYEEASVHYVIVRAERGDNYAVKTFVITVLDVNEPPGNLMFQFSTVHENQEGTLVGIISAIDPEGGGVGFFIATDPSSAFELQSGATANSRRVVTSRALDYETETSLTLGLVARDLSALTLVSETGLYTISVLNVNEAPTAIQLSPLEIDENRLRGTVVGTLTVVDPDSAHTSQGFRCSLLDSASGLFQLDGLEIKVFQSSRLDYESFAAAGVMPTVIVECSDAGSLSISQHFQITVRNIAERPTDIESATGVFEIAENNGGGAVIAHLSTTDPDTADQSTFQYEVSDPSTFAVIGQMLITHVHLNYERQNRYDIEITTTDEDGLAYTKRLTVNVLNGNDPPAGIVLTQTATLSAQSPTGTVIATLRAIDEDTAQQHRFYIQTQTPENALQITLNKLSVSMGSLFEQSVLVTIVVTDVGVVTPLIYVGTLTIAVQGVNLPPTGILLTGSSVLENSAVGTVVGNVQVEDPTSSEQLFYCVLLDDAGGRFDLARVNGQIQLQVAYSDRLDFEAEPSHSIRMSCRDSLPENTIEETFVIDVLDGPERPTGIIFTNAADGDTTTNVNPPDLGNLQGQVITLATVTVNEDAEDGVVIVAYVTVIAADGSPLLDQASPVLELISENEYNRLNRPTAGRKRRDARRLHARPKRAANTDPNTVPSQFVIPNAGQYLLVGDTLDHETQPEYMLYVKATDHNNPNLVVTAQLRVVVLDVDEAPLDMTLDPIAVSELASVDTEVGQLSVTDPDSTQSAYVYTIISQGTPFYLQQHRVRVQRPLDHEITPIITVQVRVSEINTPLQLDKNFHISVTDAHEPPTALTVDGNTTIIIPETLEVGDTVGMLIVTDPDTVSGFSFSFFYDEDSHHFFSFNNGRLVLARRLDAWTTNVLSLFIQVTDPTNMRFRQVITVRVTSDDRCSRPGYCSPYATCLRGFCTCRLGFTGDGFTCTDIDECTPYPCHIYHSLIGQCVNGFGGMRNFTCTCLPGWMGQDCTVEIDSCQKHQCNPLGTVQCLNTVNSADYTCECKRGFEGQLCDGNTDECANHQCQNQAECIDGIGLYTCKCSAPYEGYFCELDPTVCDQVTCANGGSCIPLPDRTHECRCTDPFLRDCSGCAFGYGGVDCKPCEPPFTGENCDIDSSVCVPNPCTQGGVCIPDVDKYTCVCPENVATESCRQLVVSLGRGRPTEPNDIEGEGFPGWIILVCVSVLVLLAIIISVVCLAFRRYRRIPYKASNSFIHGRARFLSETDQVIVMPDGDFLPRDHPSQDYPSQGCPAQDYPERDYPVDEEPEPPLQEQSPTVSIPEAAATTATTASATETKETDEEPEDNPPPYSPPDNLFLASALGLLPPGYEVKGPKVDVGDGDAEEKKEKLESEGDRAVAEFMETMAKPIGDRGTLQAKGSNLEDWEQSQLGLVQEQIPQQGDKRVRKKSNGRRPSLSRKLSVGAVAYQNPIYIPDNKVLSQQAVMEIQQDSSGSNAISNTDQSTPSGSGGPPASGKDIVNLPSAQTGIHDDIISDQKRSHKPSLSKSPSDVTKQNPVFQESDNDDTDDSSFE